MDNCWLQLDKFCRDNDITKFNSLNAAHYGELAYSWFGLYSPTGTPTKYFHVYVNTKAIHEYPGCNNNPGACAISSATHEFGHAQFLNDIESNYGNTSIMSYERDRTTITTPQPHDINDINSYRAAPNPQTSQIITIQPLMPIGRNITLMSLFLNSQM